jgi:hypothetical protein
MGSNRPANGTVARSRHCPRYVVTNLHGSPQWLYDHRNCPRGDMENRIKEQQ